MDQKSGTRPAVEAGHGQGPVVSRRAWIGAAGGALLATAGVYVWRSRRPVAAAVAAVPPGDAVPISVNASPTCGCCKNWVKHLEENGFKPSVQYVDDVTPTKRRLGVPDSLWSCHTAEVQGYVVEGHVPADLIHKMLKERATFAGLSTPGMPMGSPGMEGPTKDTYEVVAFSKDGTTKVYAVR